MLCEVDRFDVRIIETGQFLGCVAVRRLHFTMPQAEFGEHDGLMGRTLRAGSSVAGP